MNKQHQYNLQEIETKWYEFWKDHNYFYSSPHPEKKAYTIIMPPPNITGILHMGHVLNNTIQDVLIRKARMEGKEACWIPGIDHASIATENKVMEMLRKQNLSKENLTKETFLKHAWKWKEQYGGIIFKQLEKLGISCDWSRAQFTLDPKLSEKVRDAFIELYETGYIYKDTCLVNWDPSTKTVLSDEEVIYETKETELYYIKYNLVDEVKSITVATTRPETLFGDVAICVHPEDGRYRELKGKQVIVPIAGHTIEIITDEFVSSEFGTGCVKITPAHDANDYMVAKKHQLPLINIFNEDATLNEKGKQYQGKDRFEVRKEIIQRCKEEKLLTKVISHKTEIGFSERSKSIIELRYTEQWFLNMKALSKPALDSVMKSKIQFYPTKLKNTYKNWMRNIKDWCISRQLWWGHPIPAYYLKSGEIVVGKNKQEALEKAKKLTGNNQLTLEYLKQDPDVLDTWFSAWLWPINVLGGFEEQKQQEFMYYYPTEVVVTAPEIIFFWVARMIMAGYFFKNKPPFKKVYFTGIVRDHKRRKMSKSLGNSPDPLNLIENYGADGVRAGLLFSAIAGNDILFDEHLCKKGSNFVHKLWNVLQLVKRWEINPHGKEEVKDQLAIQWFTQLLQKNLKILKTFYAELKISDVFITTYTLIWDYFCAYFLEIIKPGLDKKIAKKTYEAVIHLLEELLKLLHPCMPFITEEIWQQLKVRSPKESLIVSSWPKIQDKIEDKKILQEAELAFELIQTIRNVRNQNKIPLNLFLTLYHKEELPTFLVKFKEIIVKLAKIKEINLTELETMKDMKKELLACHMRHHQLYLKTDEVQDYHKPNFESEKKKKELVNYIKKLSAKLENTNFLQKAPNEVVEKEKKKLKEAEKLIKSLQ